MQVAKRHHLNRKRSFPMCIQYRQKKYLAAITSGESCIIQESESGISTEISKGLPTVVMQRVHTNLEPVRFATSSDECIVSPVVTLHTREISYEYLVPEKDTYFTYIKKEADDSQSQWHLIKIEPTRNEARYSDEQAMKVDLPIKLEPISPEKLEHNDEKPTELDPSTSQGSRGFEEKEQMETMSSSSDDSKTNYSHKCLEKPEHFIHKDMKEGSLYKFKLIIPHYVDQKDFVPLIQVKWGNIYDKLTEIRKGNPGDKLEPYCEVYGDHIIVYADHFCDVICTCPERICASKLIAFPFGQIESEPGYRDPYKGEDIFV